MTQRPYVVLSCAISLDGCLDSTGPDRLVLSGAEDLDRVDAERAAADAILVGAGTIRRDDPRLLVRAPARRAARVAGGQPEHPVGVTVTASGDLDPRARFFTRVGEDGPVPPAAAPRLVYCPAAAAGELRRRAGGRAEIVPVAEPVRLGVVLADLGRRGVRRLLAEGGARLGTELLTQGLVDELQLAVAPFFVGDPAAPRFAGPGHYPAGPDRRLTLAESRQVGGLVLLRYICRNGQNRAS
jgi:5-amino-6-(5-phosphoribosylamino)uracil reductase